MRLLIPLFLFLFSSQSLTAQQLPEWYRVYTFDDSVIEMNTSLVTTISEDVTRVRFRWTFDQPEPLSGEPKLRYKSELEVMELNCSLLRYRPYHFTFFDQAGNIIRIQDSPGEWRAVASSSMMEQLFVPACELIKKTHPEVVSEDRIRLQKAAKYAYGFAQQLEQAKDFKLVIDKFFVRNFLNAYLDDKQTNWFLNLNRDTAAMLSRRELQRYYVALMNAGYLSSLYVISQSPIDSDEPVAVERLVPSDVWQLIRDHPYTARYKHQEGNYDFIAEKIDNVERLRLYTDLLERLGALMRKHVIRVAAERSKAYQAMLEDWDLYKPKVRSCGENCLGLPNGTRLFDVNVPVFHLQIAEIGGNLKVVSAMSSFQ
jgi:Surface-adhesin protein E